MCDVKKYEQIYEDIKALEPEDTLQLVMEAETEEQRSFYEMIGNYLLQMAQKIYTDSRSEWREIYFGKYRKSERKKIQY